VAWPESDAEQSGFFDGERQTMELSPKKAGGRLLIR
jgi:hypothetical protein